VPIEPLPPRALERIAALAEGIRAEMVEFRRRVHAHPELAHAEYGTTAAVAERLTAAGLTPNLLPASGLTCDIPASHGALRPVIALRADLDALPIAESTDLPYASTRRGVSHACGHDAHTAAVLGAGLVLAGLAEEGALPVRVRLVFQPAEEVQPGGAYDIMDSGALEGVERILALHCDPRVDVGNVGTRIGPITSASDSVTVTVASRGGHTSRPHLTGDVVFALGQVITQVPAVLGRRLDPRSGVNLTFGMVQAGTAVNAIPATGTVRGTLRYLDADTWHRVEEVFQSAVQQVVAPYGVEVEVSHVRGVPPVVNDEHTTEILETAARAVLGEASVELTEQSLGGEDFGWYLTRVHGGMARLGTRTPGGRSYDLHQADFQLDERAIDAGTRVLAAATLLASSRYTGGGHGTPPEPG
jgi:amidohydrolase